MDPSAVPPSLFSMKKMLPRPAGARGETVRLDEANLVPLKFLDDFGRVVHWLRLGRRRHWRRLGRRRHWQCGTLGVSMGPGGGGVEDAADGAGLFVVAAGAESHVRGALGPGLDPHGFDVRPGLAANFHLEGVHVGLSPEGSHPTRTARRGYA